MNAYDWLVEFDKDQSTPTCWVVKGTRYDGLECFDTGLTKQEAIDNIILQIKGLQFDDDVYEIIISKR
jgi:hypothetical protein